MHVFHSVIISKLFTPFQTRLVNLIYRIVCSDKVDLSHCEAWKKAEFTLTLLTKKHFV